MNKDYDKLLNNNYKKMQLVNKLIDSYKKIEDYDDYDRTKEISTYLSSLIQENHNKYIESIENLDFESAFMYEKKLSIINYIADKFIKGDFK